MSAFEDNEERIERYLEGKMNQEEREMFMQELNINEALRKQYEEELFMSALLSNDDDGEIESVSVPAVIDKNFEADARIRRIHKKARPSFPFLHSSYKYIAAAAAVIAILIAAFFLVEKKSRQPVIATSNNNKKAIPKTDSANNEFQAYRNDSISKILFSENYTKYIAKTDPAEISNYYNYYDIGEYDKVIAAKKSDYATMGIDNREQLLTGYMFFYKGLSYLAGNKNADAVKNFDSVLNSSNKNSRLYFNAEWYLALSYLKAKDLNKSQSVLNNIIQSKSFYKTRAAQILQQIKNS